MGYLAPELVDRDREQNRSLAIQKEVASGLVSHSDTSKSMGLDGIPMGAEGADGKAHQATPSFFISTG